MRNFFLVTLLMLLSLVCSAQTSIKKCDVGTVASYANTTCAQTTKNGDVVVFSFPKLEDFYFSYGTRLIAPEDIHILLDPQGPNTLLIQSRYFSVGPTELSITVLKFHVSNTNAMDVWNHYCSVDGDARVRGSQTILGEDSVLADCYAGTYNSPQDKTSFPLGSYDAQIAIRLEGGESGHASIGSVGAHFTVR